MYKISLVDIEEIRFYYVKDIYMIHTLSVDRMDSTHFSTLKIFKDKSFSKSNKGLYLTGKFSLLHERMGWNWNFKSEHLKPLRCW